MKYPDTPNLDKMLEVKDDSQKIGDFLCWLAEHGMSICTEDEHNDHDEDLGDPVRCPTCGADCVDWTETQIFIRRPVYLGVDGTNQILARYFDINYNEIERERREILEHVRSQHG